MKIKELLGKSVIVQDLLVGKVVDAIIDPEDMKLTHLEVELTKEASEQILGVTPALLRPARNTLAISALEKGAACCTQKGIELKVSKNQLVIYLRPT